MGQRKRSRGGAGVTSPEAAATGAGSGSNAGAGAGSGSDSTPRAFPEHNDVCSTPRYEMPSFSKRARHTPTWQVARSAVRTQLSESYTPPPGADIVGLSGHKKNLLSLLRRVLAAQENHSVLLVGYHGCGKSMLLRHVLSVLQREPPPGASEDGGDASAPGPQQPRFRLIMLDGHVLRDDAEALREISRQLSLNIDTDAMFGTDGVVMGGSDTAADLAGGGAGAGPATPGGAASVSASSITKFTGLTGPSSRRHLPSKQARKSFDQHLSFVVGAMRDGRASNVPVVLVLDHFEGFAESRKQTLLYNLFDLTQSASVQVAVIGLTSRLDAVDMLEKRLKSRFSHRQLLFTTPPVDVVKQILLSALRAPPSLSKVFVESFNQSMARLLDTKEVMSLLRRETRAGRSVRWFLRWFDEVIACHMVATPPFLGLQSIVAVHRRISADPLLALVNDMSRLDVYILVAMAHLDFAHDKPFNFEMVYEEYARFASSDISSLQTFPKAVAFKTFEYLMGLGLGRYISKDSSDAAVPTPFQKARLVVEPYTLLDKVGKGEFDVPTELQQWARSRVQG